MLMKAVVRSDYGDTDVLRITRLERPVPQKDEVLIRVKAAGLDRSQWHLMTGTPFAKRLATGLAQPKQQVLGMEERAGEASTEPQPPKIIAT